MGWHKFLMKHGLGSPSYIAKRMARRYRTLKGRGPPTDEQAIIRHIFVERVAAQGVLGGPAQYRFLKSHPPAIAELVSQHPDLFSIVSLAVFIEHPELLSPGAPPDAFSVLNETMEEVLDAEVPEWRTEGVWRKQTIVCSLCHANIDRPNPALMSAALNENGEPEFMCTKCSLSLQIRAMMVLGFFMGR
jgi:hypothetical protein